MTKKKQQNKVRTSFRITERQKENVLIRAKSEKLNFYRFLAFIMEEYYKGDNKHIDQLIKLYKTSYC
jgi:hypothetical protein